MLGIIVFTILITVIVYSIYKVVVDKYRLRGTVASLKKDERRELITFTKEQLAVFDGRDESTPIYISIKVGKASCLTPSI